MPRGSHPGGMDGRPQPGLEPQPIWGSPESRSCRNMSQHMWAARKLSAVASDFCRCRKSIGKGHSTHRLLTCGGEGFCFCFFCLVTPSDSGDWPSLWHPCDKHMDRWQPPCNKRTAHGPSSVQGPTKRGLRYPARCRNCSVLGQIW